MSTPSNPPAFPKLAYITKADEDGDSATIYESDGASLRDYFAAKAIQEAGTQLRKCESNNEGWTLPGGKRLVSGSDVFDAPSNIAIVAYSIADAMLAEREKGTK